MARAEAGEGAGDHEFQQCIGKRPDETEQQEDADCPDEPVQVHVDTEDNLAQCEADGHDQEAHQYQDRANAKHDRVHLDGKNVEHQAGHDKGHAHLEKTSATFQAPDANQKQDREQDASYHGLAAQPEIVGQRRTEQQEQQRAQQVKEVRIAHVPCP